MKKMIRMFNEFCKLTSLIYKNNWRYVWAIVFLCMIVFSFDALAPSVIIERIFAAVSLGNTQYLMNVCLQIMLVLACVLIISIAFFLFSNAWFSLISNRSCSILFQEFFKMPHAAVCNQFSDGEIYNRLVSGANHTISVFSASTQLFTTAVSSIILVTMLAQKSYQFLWFAAAYFLVVAARTSIETKRNMLYQTNIQQSAAKQAQQLHVLLENLEQTQMCGMTALINDQWVDSRKSYWKWKNKREQTKALLDFISAVAFGGFQMAAYATLKVIKPAISVITSVMTLLNRYSDNLTIACGCATSLPTYFVPIYRLIEFLQKNKAPEKKSEISEKDASSPAALSVSDVNLVLNENHVLKGINFSIKPNEKVALIGQNGCGKSTVLKAIGGQFNLNSGEICLSSEGEEDTLAYIPVTPQLFSVSSLENISMGTTAPEHTYNTSIALDFLEQTGTNLSGGQQQRVNIYRAIVGNKKLLLADEPTSALNPELKDFYMNLIIHSSSTLLAVTHDPTVLSQFDRIMIMSQGKIVEDGKYSDVIQTKAYLQWLGSLNFEVV